jgi:hypothetical protein
VDLHTDDIEIEQADSDEPDFTFVRDEAGRLVVTKTPPAPF